MKLQLQHFHRHRHISHLFIKTTYKMPDCPKGYVFYKKAADAKARTRKKCKMNNDANSITITNGTICKKKNYSHIPIEQDDLDILYDVITEWLHTFQTKNTKYKDMKLMGICMCQGSAQHFVDKGEGRGLNDFDIWIFFEKQADVPDFPVRLVYTAFFPNNKFGTSTNCINKPGRRIDIMGRSIKESSISEWLHKSKNKSAHELRKAPVILLKRGSYERLL
jgi:hypothetical protein